MVHLRHPGAFLSAIFVLFWPAPAGAQAFPLEEYEQHVARYLSSLENLAVEFTQTSHAPDGSNTIHDEVSLISIPGHFRAKVVGHLKFKNGPEKRVTMWALMRPDGYHRIIEEAEGEFLYKGTHPEVNSASLAYWDTHLNPLRAPLGEGNYPINRIIRDGFGAIYSFETKDFQRQRGKNAAGYTFRALRIGKNDQDRSEAEIEMNERWLVTKYRAKSKRGEFKREITYTMLEDRMLPARITTVVTDASGKSKTPPGVIEFRNYRVYEGTKADFGFAQFGLPEPYSFIRRVVTNWFVWFIVIAGGCLVMGWYWRRRVLRRLAAGTPTTAKAKVSEVEA